MPLICEYFRLIFTIETELGAFTTDTLSLLLLILLLENSPLFLLFFTPWRPLITETCSKARTVGRLRSQNGLGQKWLLGISLVVQWLRFWVSTAGDPGQGIKIPHPTSGGTAKQKKRLSSRKLGLVLFLQGHLSYLLTGMQVSLIPCGRKLHREVNVRGWDCQGVGLLGETHWLKLLTLAGHQSNHLHELFSCRRSW